MWYLIMAPFAAVGLVAIVNALFENDPPSPLD
jgi:hypothetical protein